MRAATLAKIGWNAAAQRRLLAQQDDLFKRIERTPSVLEPNSAEWEEWGSLNEEEDRLRAELRTILGLSPKH